MSDDYPYPYYMTGYQPEPVVTVPLPPAFSCNACGARVDAEHQRVHNEWHVALDEKLAQLEVALFRESLTKMEADLDGV